MRIYLQVINKVFIVDSMLIISIQTHISTNFHNRLLQVFDNT